MASGKKYRNRVRTEHVEDSSVADDTDLRTFLLTDHDYNRYVRFCFMGNAEAVKQLHLTATEQLQRIGVKADPGKAVATAPQGSEQNNLQSLYVWMSKLNKKYKQAVGQLQVLQATAARRLGI